LQLVPATGHAAAQKHESPEEGVAAIAGGFGYKVGEVSAELRMCIKHALILVALALSVLTASARADDCATVKNAMLGTGRTPHGLTLTKTDGQGKKTVTRQVQTVDNKYVQTADGKWHAMNIAIKDLDDDLSGVQMCRRSGSESVSGESTTVYDVHMNQDGDQSDAKIWVSSKNLVLKSETVLEGGHYTTEYDFRHVTPPANAVPMGGK
jgi:hypothetical protein